MNTPVFLDLPTLPESHNDSVSHLHVTGTITIVKGEGTLLPVRHRNRSHKVVPSGSLLFTSFLLMIATAILLTAQDRSRIGTWEVSGPYQFRNLSIVLFHGESVPRERPVLTLEQGLERGLVKVYETGSVNELAVENLSDEYDLFIHAGDIVKGGRQDRTLGYDLTLSPGSGRVPIASFCVEQGRWSARAEEPSTLFSSSKGMISSNELRLAVKEKKNQSVVWSEVSVTQDKLSSNLGVMVNHVGDSAVAYHSRQGVSSGIQNGEITSEDLRDARVIRNDIEQGQSADNVVVQIQIPQPSELQSISLANISNVSTVDVGNLQVQQNAVSRTIGGVNTTTSLQLSLEHDSLRAEIESYLAEFRSIVDGKDDVIGFAFIVNGRTVNADLYQSTELFTLLWPKLLRAAATQAVAEGENRSSESGGEHAVIDPMNSTSTVGPIALVRNCIDDISTRASRSEEVNGEMRSVTRKSDANILFETVDPKDDDVWIHRNYMSLD